MQGCSKAVPKFGPPGVPSNLSTPLLPLCFQYTFLKGNNRAVSFWVRLAASFWVRLADPKGGRMLHVANQNSTTTDAGILEFLIPNPHTPPRVIAVLGRRTAAQFHPARSPRFQPPSDDNCNPVSHSGKNKLYSTAPSPWTASISVQLSLSQGFQPRHPPAPSTARSHR